MRQDTESLNAQLERAFYGQRLPSWGNHNQTTIVLMAALADNAWARHIWFDQLEHQDTGPPRTRPPRHSRLTAPPGRSPGHWSVMHVNLAPQAH
jgi:hypothetical protein